MSQVCKSSPIPGLHVFECKFKMQNNQKLGIGSGSTIVFAVQRLGE